jgi:hypothetical protein
VKHFLVVYHRRRGELVRMTEYADELEALGERFALERERGADRSLEIVVLSSDSEETVRVTHRRYFEDVPQLLRRLADAI